MNSDMGKRTLFKIHLEEKNDSFIMAEEGASSSSTSVDEVDNGQESKAQSYSANLSTLSANDTSCSTVSSSGHVASSSQGIIGMPRLSCNPFAIKSSTPTKSVADSTDNKDSRPVIAPPVLKLDNAASKIVLRPSALALQAEKLKSTNKHDSDSKQEGKENSSDESNIVKERFSMSESNGKLSKSEIFTSSSISTSTDKTVSSSSKTCATESNYFTFTKKKPEDLPSNGGFVFGQNLHERVLNYDSSNDHPASPPDSHNLTFEEAALKKEDLEKMEQQNQEEKMKKSLTESAKEYESRQVKRKFDEVAVITGEEEESNVLQINCKLFAFDKTNMNWQERGRGTLRLNDREHNGTLHSRLVMRVQGSLRVVLNTKVWSGMSVERQSEKSVRLTAFDPQGVKVFLVMAQPKDADQLYNALNCRVATLRSDNLKNNDNLPVVEEATSSSTLPDDLDSSCKHIRLSDNCSADSSTEASFPPQDTSSESGTADSTDVQS